MKKRNHLNTKQSSLYVMIEKKYVYPLDFVVTQTDTNLHVKMFGLDDAYNRVEYVDESFYNYAYVLLHQNTSQQKIQETVEKIQSKKGDFKLQSVHIKRKKYFGDEYDGIFVQLSTLYVSNECISYFESLDTVKAVLEADLPIIRKYILQRKIVPLSKHLVESTNPLKLCCQYKNVEYKKLKVLAFDIETYAESNRIDTHKNPILSIAIYTKDEQKVFTWSSHKSSLSQIVHCKTEQEMIESFFSYLQKNQPHFVCGYNSDSFDWSYIQDRCDQFNITPSFSPIQTGLQFSGGSQRYVHIKGMPHIDLFQFIRINFKNQLQTTSYSLDAVSKELLDNTKDSVDITKLYDAWNTKDSKKLDEYLLYNIQDCKLCYDLFEKLFVNMFEFIALIPLPLQDLVRMSYSQLVEWYLIFRSLDFDIVVPNRPSGNELEHRLSEPKNEGAFVYKPNPGLYSNIVVFDFQSLYPSIISSLHLEKDTFNRDTKSENAVPEMNQQLYFSKTHPTFIAEVITDIITRRIQIKKELQKTTDESKKQFLKARIYNLKILANSMYGYLAFAHARWHCNEAAAATTAYARHYIKYTINEAKKQGFSVIYGDTDSIFLELKDKTKDDAVLFVSQLNRTLPGIMELQFENFFESGIFVQAKSGGGGAKKRYALYAGNDTFKITGLEYVRTDWCDYARQTQFELIKILLAQKDVKKAVLFVKRQMKRLENRDVSISELILSAKLSRDVSEYTTNLPHVILAKKLLQRGEQVKKGSRISYVVQNGSGAVYERVGIPDEVSINDIDSHYYIHNQLLPVVLSILEVFAITKDELLANDIQNDLTSFFG